MAKKKATSTPAKRKRPPGFLIYLDPSERARLEALREKLEADEAARLGITRRLSAGDVTRLALARLAASELPPAPAEGEAPTEGGAP